MPGERAWCGDGPGGWWVPVVHCTHAAGPYQTLAAEACVRTSASPAPCRPVVPAGRWCIARMQPVVHACSTHAARMQPVQIKPWHRAAACVRASCFRGKAADVVACARGGWVELLIRRPVGWGWGGGAGGWGQGVWGREGGPPLPHPTPRPGRDVGVGVLEI
jgi:hypothetical protein